MMKYRISSISRLRMGTDGEGIRTLIVTAGCLLRCKYCINPFTWDGSRKTQLLTAKEIYDKLVLDRPYLLATNGGITFGGGEPLLQPELIVEMREYLEKDLTIYAETALNVPWEDVERCASAIDCYHIDIKSMDPDIYRDYTGKELQPVVDNLKRLLELKGPEAIVVRIPQIPEMAGKESQLESKRALEKLGIRQFDLFRYVINR